MKRKRDLNSKKVIPICSTLTLMLFRCLRACSVSPIAVPHNSQPWFYSLTQQCTHFEHPVLVTMHGFCKSRFCTVLSILLFICPKLMGQHGLLRQLFQNPSAAPRSFVSALGRGRKYIWTESYIPTLSNQKPLEVAGVAGGTNCLGRTTSCSFK